MEGGGEEEEKEEGDLKVVGLAPGRCMRSKTVSSPCFSDGMTCVSSLS